MISYIYNMLYIHINKRIVQKITLEFSYDNGVRKYLLLIFALNNFIYKELIYIVVIIIIINVLILEYL